MMMCISDTNWCILLCVSMCFDVASVRRMVTAPAWSTDKAPKVAPHRVPLGHQLDYRVDTGSGNKQPPHVYVCNKTVVALTYNIYGRVWQGGWGCCHGYSARSQ